MPTEATENLRATLGAAALPLDYYAQPTLAVARQLLGKVLLAVNSEDSPLETNTPIALENLVGGLIVETEGYVGQDDPACHAYRGRTARNGAMWDDPGHAYVYFTYGNHWMINVVTEQSGFPAAVLIRALEPLIGLDKMRARRTLHLLKAAPAKHSDRNLTNGPGKLCQALDINRSLNNQSLNGPLLYICDPAKLSTVPQLAKTLPPFATVETTRIGISKGVELPWRYYVKGNPYVSKL